ncbi:hypothetical protein CYMTET_8019 [Cymbomonas tetramitiformis]|uniref:Methyltransferase type 11 domain-containing protein n=1 Tax=Cymbomonas tetramitiformis TaxID=36881 RepID=A0AAE0LGW9_9CHLO|nr:hypothetical protein CYMTET_8019 [Cymbomonas tetramitiformis]
MVFSTIISGITEARMALTTWHTEAAETRCGLLDMRSAADFSLLHVRGSTNIPAEQVQERSFELPPRGSTLAILADDLAALEETIPYLHGNGYTLVPVIGLPQPSSQALEHVLEGAGLEERGAVCPPVYLWKPSPCFAEAMAHIEKLLLSEKLETFTDLDNQDSEARCTAGVPASLAVDVGCGAGRDCVWLASRQAVVWDVVGIDNDERLLERYKASSFSRSHRREANCFLNFAEKTGTSHRCTAVLADVQRTACLSDYANRCCLVHVSRYLHRPTLPAIKAMVAPGGFIVFHQFMEGSQSVGPCRPKNSKFLLQAGELRDLFAGWQVLMDDVRPISDGRPLSYFAARRPPVDMGYNETYHSRR